APLRPLASRRRMRRKRDARRWVRHAIGGAAAAAALRGAPAHAACSGSGLHTVSVGVHLGIAFGGTGWPVKLNYGFTGRVGEGVALPPLLARTDCARADDALASAWLDDARAELASVPSFLRLAEELGALGAPGWLRRAALVAADEERDHAMAAFAMASRWA